jgi:hypothetical protein
MGTRHLYWILSGPSFAVRVLYRVQIIYVHITVRNKIGHNYSGIQLSAAFSQPKFSRKKFKYERPMQIIRN